MSYGLLAIVSAWLIFFAVSFGVAVSAAQKAHAVWEEWQIEHLQNLRASYADGSAVKVDESVFCGFDIEYARASGVKINELRYLATHNSYKLGLSDESSFFYNRAMPLIMGEQYDYEFDTITEQFNNGIRSIEIDINKIITDDGFKLSCLHSYLLEQNSSMIDMRRGLEEMKMWSDYNPNHMPVVVLVEPKGGLAGTKYASMDKEAYEAFDAMLAEVFGESLLTPSSVLGEYSNFASVRAANAYPTLQDTQGKFIFVLHEKSTLDNYIAIDNTMRAQKMFIAIADKKTLKDESYLDKALFVIYNNDNNKQLPKIRSAVEDGNFIVRTRLDKYALIDAERKMQGIASGAQIMSTDYPYSPSGRYGYICQLTPQNHTVILR
jgi:hypothetical protein